MSVATAITYLAIALPITHTPSPLDFTIEEVNLILDPSNPYLYLQGVHMHTRTWMASVGEASLPVLPHSGDSLLYNNSSDDETWKNIIIVGRGI